jgi:hypothetical protein
MSTENLLSGKKQVCVRVRMPPDPSFQPSAFQQEAKTKPNEANEVKPCGMSVMYEKFRKRSQDAQAIYYQIIRTKNGPIFGKNEFVPSMNCRLPSLDARRRRGHRARGRGTALYPFTVMIPAKAGIHGLSRALETLGARGMAILDMAWSWELPRENDRRGNRQLRPVAFSSTIAPQIQVRREREWRR